MMPNNKNDRPEVSSEEDEDEAEISVIKEVPSPPVADSRGTRGTRHRPTTTRKLAMKREAKEEEEERLDRVIMDAGMDPSDYDFDNKKVR